MNISPGKILISSPSLTDPNFEKVVIYIAEYNKKGTLGYVINTLFPRAFNELILYTHSPPLILYDGGPMEKESLFFLHCRPDLIAGGIHIIDSIYLGGDFKQAVKNINEHTIPENDIKLFIGYCGWNYGQLEEEVAEGCWLVFNTTAEMVFNPSTQNIWKQLYDDNTNL